MSLPKGYHVQMVITDSTGKLVNILPVVVGTDVKVDASQNESITVSINNLQDLIDNLGKLAFQDEIDKASISAEGIVKLSNVINDTTAQNTAATTAAVSMVSEVANRADEVSKTAVQNTGDETVEGFKKFTDGVDLNGARITSTTSESGNTILVEFR